MQMHTVVESTVVCPQCGGVGSQSFDCGDSFFTIDHACGFAFDSSRDLLTFEIIECDSSPDPF